MLTNKVRLGLISFISIVLLSACIEEEDKKAINNAFEPEQQQPLPDDRVDNKLCHTDSFRQPEAEIIKKIDIAFVVDTSGSLDAEREEIANGIDSFIQELPSDVDYQVGVILGHGDKSKHSGKLYGLDNNPKVLSSTNMSIGEIRQHLGENMTEAAGDNDTDGGEAGLYSLKRALTDKLESNKQLGFFREDAALAVIFVADENDICTWNSPPAGVQLVNDPDRAEIPASKKYCDGINPAAIYSLLKNQQQDRPLLVSGIIYTNNETIPDKGENEIGYGYLETILEGNGAAIDLADGDYQLGMRDLGFLAMKKLNLLTEFKLSKTGFDKRSLRIDVDRSPVDFVYSDSANEIQIQHESAGRENSEIMITYCMSKSEDPIAIDNIETTFPNNESAIIEWDTALDSTAQISYRVAGGEVLYETDFFPTLSSKHAVELYNLFPDTLYEVTIISSMEIDGKVKTDTKVVFIRTEK